MVRQIATGNSSHPNGQKMGLKEGLPKEGQSRTASNPSFTLVYFDGVTYFNDNGQIDNYWIPQVSGFRMARKV